MLNTKPFGLGSLPSYLLNPFNPLLLNLAVSIQTIKAYFRQSKNYIQANAFYSLEMKAYERFLEKKLGIEHKEGLLKDFLIWFKLLGKMLKKRFKSNKEEQELLVLKTHKLASDFGQSWIRPLVWIILVSISFALIKYLHKEEIPYRYLPDWVGSILNSIVKLLNEFAKALLIIPGKDKIQGIEFISLITYILLAFFTYQFIVAVRRKVIR